MGAHDLDVVARLPLKSGFRFHHEPWGAAHQAEEAALPGRSACVDAFAKRLLFSTGGSHLVAGFRGVGKTSYVNQVLARVQELRPSLPLPAPPVTLLDVPVNLPRAVSAMELMTLVIRNLYSQLGRSGLRQRLTRPLREQVELMLLRTSAKVSDASSMRADFGVQGPKWLPFKSGFQKNVSRALAWGEYDERTAEQDLVNLAAELRTGLRPQWPWQRSRHVLRPVIVFDELDKVDDLEAVKNTISQLKGLLTTPGIVFVFVVGKDFIDHWAEDVARGNSVLESVFCNVEYVPAMWDVADVLCTSLLDAGAHPDVDTSATLAGFLGYAGRGIPRQVLRHLYDFVAWDDLSPELVFNRRTLRRLRFFARLQLDFKAKANEMVLGLKEGAADPVLDERRLAIFYLMDWVWGCGSTPITRADMRAAVANFGAGLAPNDELVRAFVDHLVDWLLEHDYLEEVAGTQTQLDLAPGDLTGHSDRISFRVPKRRLIEMGLDLRPNSGAQAKVPPAPPPPPDSQASEAPLWSPAALKTSSASTAVPEQVQTDLAGQLHDLRYRGEGGASVVYAGIDRAGRTLAVKAYRNTSDQRFLARVQREVKVLKTMRHANVVAVQDVIEVEGRIYLLMDYIDGRSLHHVIGDGLDEPLVLELYHQVLDAVAALHAEGVIWRDVKPSNVMVDRGGHARIVDFGVALHTAEESLITLDGAIVGTPAYMAPEAVLGETVDRRSDIYSLGVLLYEMLSGRLPFRAESMMQLLQLIQHAEPAPAKALELATDSVRAACLRCLAKAPDARFATVDELRAALPPVPADSQWSPVLVEREAETLGMQTIVGPPVPAAAPIAGMPGQPERAQADAAGSVDGQQTGPGLLMDGTLRPLEPGRGPFTIGRSQECWLRVNAPGVSRFHAEVVEQGGHWFLQDMNTVNGTVVAGSKAGYQGEPLADGADIDVGGAMLRFIA